MKIKILLILPQHQVGGAEIQLLNLISNIDKDRFMIYLGLLYHNKELEKEFHKIPGVKIINFHKKSKLDLMVFYRIGKFAKKENIDIIQTFLANHHAYLPSVFAKKSIPLGGIRSTFYDDKSISETLLRFKLQKLFSKRKDMHLISNSHSGKEIYVKRGIPEDSILVVPNGVDYDKFSNGNRDKILDEFHLRGKIVLGMVSRIDKRKNHRELIEVYSDICKVKKNVSLLIIGDGPDLVELKRMVKEKGLGSKVIFTGTRRDIHDLLSAMDIFVFPSKFPEGWPNAVGEAMSSGLPVISYPCGDVDHIITDDYDGIIIPRSDRNVFKKRLLELIADKRLRTYLGANAKKTIQSKFTIPVMVHRYEKIYQDLVDKRN